MRTALPQHTNIGNRTEQNKRTRNRASKRIRTNQSNARHVPPFLKCIHDRRMRCAMCDGGYPSKPLCAKREGTTHTLSPLPLTVSAIVALCRRVVRLCVVHVCWLCGVPTFLFSASSCSRPPPLPLFFSDFMRDTKNTCTCTTGDRAGTQTNKRRRKLY